MGRSLGLPEGPEELISFFHMSFWRGVTAPLPNADLGESMALIGGVLGKKSSSTVGSGVADEAAGELFEFESGSDTTV